MLNKISPNTSQSSLTYVAKDLDTEATTVSVEDACSLTNEKNESTSSRSFEEEPAATNGASSFRAGMRHRNSVGSSDDDVVSVARTTASTLRKRHHADYRIIESSGAASVKSKVLSELTINKLKTDSMGLIGREREYTTLKHSLKRLTKKTRTTCPAQNPRVKTLKKEMIFIQGYTGVGKTALARALEKDVAKMGGAFVQGKFDVQNIDSPYSGIAKAFGQICLKLKSGVNGSFPILVADDIYRVLGSDINNLSALIPELADVSFINNSINTNSNVSGNKQLDGEVEKGQVRWKYMFRTLATVLNKHISPLVILLDDLQWTDVSSLEVLDYLISDIQNKNPMMIIGCYRSNEVDENSILFNRIQSLQEKQSKYDFNIKELELQGCTEDEINRLILHMMSMDEGEKTRGLAKICYKRTGGNPYFLIEFMEMLHREELLTYNLGLMKWIWDEKKIDDETMSTENVVDLLQLRMRELPGNVQMLLQYAACLGFSFSVKLLSVAWENEGTVEGHIMILRERNFIEKCGEDEYRWVHDRIQEAALSFNDRVTSEFKFRIGTSLFYRLDEDELEERLFDVVDLINQEGISKRPEYATLNLRAAKKAKKVSAFQSAAKYIVQGIHQLPMKSWMTHRSLTLELYTLGAEIAVVLGNSEALEDYCDAILSKEDCTVMESFPIRMAQLLRMSMTDSEVDEAIATCLSLLDALEFKMIWSNRTMAVQSIMAFNKIVKLTKESPPPDQFYEKVGTLTDPRLQAVLQVLATLVTASWHTSNSYLILLCCCKMVEITLKHGAGDVSANGLVNLGMCVGMINNDFPTAAAIADRGLALDKAVQGGDKASSIFLSHIAVYPWTQPFQACLPEFDSGYTLGMRLGYSETALWCLFAHRIWVPYIVGKPLAQILEQLPLVAQQMDEAPFSGHKMFTKMYWQTIINLTTPSKSDPRYLEGEIFRASAVTPTDRELEVIEFLQEELLIFLDIEAAADVALDKGRTVAKLTGAYNEITQTFHRGIALFAMARRSGKRSYRKGAMKYKKKIQQWLDNGNPNMPLFNALLGAEEAVLKRKYSVAQSLYQKAIALAAKTGQMHHAALFNERYAEFQCEIMDDEREWAFRVQEAIRFYEEWGAMTKVELLKSELK